MTKRPRFKKKSTNSFQVELKKRVENWFKETKVSPYANNSMKFKTALLILAYLLVGALILSNQFQGLSYLAIWALFGIVQGLIGFNIAHDTAHNSFFETSKYNRWLGYIYDWNGESSFVWKETHNGLHHTFTNISGHDQDIGKGGLLRFSPNDNWHPIHQFQYIYTPLLYSLVSLSWVLYGDYVGMFDIIKNGRAKAKDIAVFFFFKACNLFCVIALPLMVVSAPAWQTLLGFLMMHMVCGVLISIIFQLAHVVEGVDFPLPDSQGCMGEEWAVHELRTTSNFATHDKVLTWFLGGLNFQVEHHLFPQICHVHYPELSKIVKKTALEYGLPYHEKPTFLAAIQSHFQLLKNLGLNPFKKSSPYV